MNTTAIGWTDFSANPLKYRDAAGAVKWACAKVSAGCANCYSEALAKRWNRGGDYNAGEVAKLTPFMDAKELRAMLTSRKISGKRVFVGDMTDLFGEWVTDELLDQLFAVFAVRSDVTWQVLTKRDGRMSAYFETRGKSASFWKTAANALGYALEFQGISLVQFPLPNVWIGVSIESRDRLPRINSLPEGWITFASFEPLLEDVRNRMDSADFGRLSWAIIGGESGPRFRDCGVDPIVDLARQCKVEGVPVFVKQDAHRLPGQQGRIPDQFWLKEFPA